MRGVYIHIPFCKQKCIYCDFTSFAGKKEIQERYVQAVIKEIKNWKAKNEFTQIDTIYIGGGTPSVIESKYIVNILETLKSKITPNCEITIEVNPGTATAQKLEDYKKAGINRLSIGLQSTHNNLLKLLGRIHNFEDFLSTYKLAREIGFQNINVDLMIGLPMQTVQDIKESLEKIISLNLEHISVYSLIIEENTEMEKLINRGILKLPDENLEREMYWFAKEFLQEHKYNHYEISNFAKKGFESKHNMNCWNQKQYVGFGIAAHSYVDDKRFSNIIDINKYIKNIEGNEYQKNIVIHEKQDKIDKEKEFMLLGLRKINGINIQDFKDKFDEDPLELFNRELNRLNKNELIMIKKDKIQLTNIGLDLANLVWEEFI